MYRGLCAHTHLIQFQYTCTRAVIAKVFRQADTEETGVVEASQVPALAAKVLGSGAKESDLQLVQYLSESKSGEEGREGERRREEGG